jgi:DNA-binding CsgD family transcriptional regulator
MINTQFLDDIKIINEQNKYNLNKREIEVINLILQEYSTTRIAKTLGLKSNTISTFKKNIFLKVRVKSTIGLYKLIMKS